MEIKTFLVNPFQQNTYLVYDQTKEAILIDCGCFSKAEQNLVVQFIDDNKLVLKRLINTHLHLDHQFGNKFIFEKYGIKAEANVEDEFLLKSVSSQAASFGIKAEDAIPLGAYINEGDVIMFGDSSFVAIHVPGHCPGHLAFYSAESKALFAGDVLFRGSIGRTDLPKGDYATLIKSITEKLLVLPEDTVVYSGHGPTSTIGYEKVNNPYL